MGLPPGSSRVEVTIRPTDDGSVVRLVHRGLPGDLWLLHDDGWHRFTDRLVAALGGAPVPAYPVETPEARRVELEAAGREDAP